MNYSIDDLYAMDFAQILAMSQVGSVVVSETAYHYQETPPLGWYYHPATLSGNVSGWVGPSGRNYGGGTAEKPWNNEDARSDRVTTRDARAHISRLFSTYLSATPTESEISRGTMMLGDRPATHELDLEIVGIFGAEREAARMAAHEAEQLRITAEIRAREDADLRARLEAIQASEGNMYQSASPDASAPAIFHEMKARQVAANQPAIDAYLEEVRIGTLRAAGKTYEELGSYEAALAALQSPGRNIEDIAESLGIGEDEINTAVARATTRIETGRAPSDQELAAARPVADPSGTGGILLAVGAAVAAVFLL